MGIQRQTRGVRGGPTNFTIAKTRILENRGEGTFPKRHAYSWLEFFLEKPHTGELQGVNKVRRHCSITYNFRINVHSILKLYRHTNRFNTKVCTLLPLLQLYFI